MLAPSPPSLFAAAQRAAPRRPAPFLPMTRQEMEALGWEQCDVIIVTGDAYVDHPSFGMAIIGRLLEAQGLRVGIIAQPDWQSTEAFRRWAGRACSSASPPGTWIRWSTATPPTSASAATTPTRRAARRPAAGPFGDRVFAARCARPGATCPSSSAASRPPCGASRTSTTGPEKVRRSILLDAKADLLLYGNAERQVVEIAHRLDAGESMDSITRPARHGIRAARTPAIGSRSIPPPRCAGRAESAGRSLCHGAGPARVVARSPPLLPGAPAPSAVRPDRWCASVVA
jgi:hypothetical protein